MGNEMCARDEVNRKMGVIGFKFFMSNSFDYVPPFWYLFVKQE